MMANALGFDYGRVLANVESVKTARLRRESAKLDLDQKKKVVGDQDNALALRTRAVQGDQSAVSELVALDPAAAQQFMSAFSAMSEEDRTKQREGIEFMGRAAAFVLTSDKPAEAYQALYNQAPPEVQAALPKEYNENFVRLQAARATQYDQMMDSLFKKDEAAAKEKADIRAEDRKHQNAVKLEKVKAEMKKASEGGGRALKAADTNAILRQTTNYFDGIFGPDGEVRLTDPKDAAKLQKLTAAASRIYANSTMTHAESVKQAADELGYGLTGGGSGGGDNDPLGLRGG